VNCSGLWHELGQLREGLVRLERAVTTAVPDDPALPISTALLAWLLLSVDLDRDHRLAQRAAHVVASDELTPTVIVWLVESAVHAAGHGEHDESRRDQNSLRSRSAATGLVVPPSEERRLAEAVDAPHRRGLLAL
jgi:hypothetical protein